MQKIFGLVLGCSVFLMLSESATASFGRQAVWSMEQQDAQDAKDAQFWHLMRLFRPPEQEEDHNDK